MKILVLNCGSSSLKFQLLQTEGPAAAQNDVVLARGLVDSIGGPAIVRLEVPFRIENLLLP